MTSKDSKYTSHKTSRPIRWGIILSSVEESKNVLLLAIEAMSVQEQDLAYLDTFFRSMHFYMKFGKKGVNSIAF